MEQDSASTQRVVVLLDTDEQGALDALCAEDLRSRPKEIKFLLGQEVARREAAKMEKAA